MDIKKRVWGAIGVVKSQALILVEDMDWTRWRWIKHSTKKGGVEVDRKNLRTEEIQ